MSSHTFHFCPTPAIPASLLARPSTIAHLELSPVGVFIPATLSPSDRTQDCWTATFQGVTEEKLRLWESLEGWDVRVWVWRGEKLLGFLRVEPRL